MIRNYILLVALATSACAQGWLLSPVENFQSSSAVQEDSDYEEGLRELDARQ